MVRDKKKSSLKERLIKRYRFIIRCDEEHAELWSIVSNKLKVYSLIASSVVVFAFIVYLILAFTPAKELIPGYDEDLRMNVVRNYFRLDSLENEIRIRDQYFNNINAIVSGKAPIELEENDSEFVSQEDVTLKKSDKDSIINRLLANEDGYEESFNRLYASYNNISNLHFFPPVKGYVTGSYNSLRSHYGTDIVTEPDAVVKATLSGTVTMASWTLETGYVIQIQHSNNLLSVYKHNAALWKNEGDYVETGEAIAIVGNSGELTTGPHLHFELWYNGTPLNTENFVAF